MPDVTRARVLRLLNSMDKDCQTILSYIHGDNNYIDTRINIHSLRNAISAAEGSCLLETRKHKDKEDETV